MDLLLNHPKLFLFFPPGLDVTTWSCLSFSILFLKTLLLVWSMLNLPWTCGLTFKKGFLRVMALIFTNCISQLLLLCRRTFLSVHISLKWRVYGMSWWIIDPYLFVCVEVYIPWWICISKTMLCDSWWGWMILFLKCVAKSSSLIHFLTSTRFSPLFFKKSVRKTLAR